MAVVSKLKLVIRYLAEVSEKTAQSSGFTYHLKEKYSLEHMPDRAKKVISRTPATADRP